MTDKFKHELQSFPTPFLRAIQRNEYSKAGSQFSVTELLSPPKRTWLKTKMEKVETPYSSFAALLGTAVHKVLEDNADPSQGEIAERRFFMDIMGITVSGQCDFYEHRTVTDYKTTRGVQGQAKPDHVAQAHMNGRLAQHNGLEVQNISVLYIQLDWSNMQAQLNPTYPQSPFKIFIHPYDEKEADQLFARTVADHMQAALGDPRECTDSEMWAKPDTYALMKPGAKRASKVCASLNEAEQEKKPGQIVQTRKGDRVYCRSFCGYNAVCESWQKYLIETQSNPPEEEP